MREGKRMSLESNEENKTPYKTNTSYDKYSRSAGVDSYRRRRRQGRAFAIASAIVLIAVIGSAAVMFGSRVLDMPRFWEGTQSQSSGSAEQEVQQTEITTVQPSEIKLVAAGDVIINGSARESSMNESGGYSYGHLFSEIKGEVSSFDIRVVNQETNLPGDSFGAGRLKPLNASQSLGNAEMEAGFNVILRANDHVLDNGYEGMHNELVWWHDTHPQIPLLGITEPDPETNPGFSDYVNSVYVYDRSGFKIAILNHTIDVPEEDEETVSPLTEQKIAADVQKARDAGAQMIVAFPHWGTENDTEVTEEQHSFAQAYANNGVDVVIGTHPRVLQAAEVLNGADGHKTVCFYSLGCLTSSLEQQNFVGGLAEVTFVRNEKGECSIKDPVLKPVVTYRANGKDYTTYLLSAYTDEIAQRGWDYLMPEAVTQRCSEILGEGYNTETSELRL